jgi:hypothetical protein
MSRKKPRSNNKTAAANKVDIKETVHKAIKSKLRPGLGERLVITPFAPSATPEFRRIAQPYVSVESEIKIALDELGTKPSPLAKRSHDNE